MEKERLAIVETKIDLIQKTLDEMHGWMKNRDEYSDKRYAPRWIMYPILTIGSTILVALAGAILGLILVPTASAVVMIYLKFIS